MLISIVIPAYNEEKYLGQTIERIQHTINENSVAGFSWEIIVCDNNSTDKTAELAFQLAAKVTFEPINQISRARNTGAAAASGEWLLFIDADSYPTPELIADTLDVFSSGVYIGCGTTVLVEGGTLFNKLRMERMNPIFWLLNISGGAFLACERGAFESVNGFSTNLYAYEEIDFVLRLRRYGRSQNKKFKVIHKHPVITSGRKGDYNIVSMAVLFASNFMAVILFFLHYLLPKRFFKALGARLLGYWYRDGR